MGWVVAARPAPDGYTLLFVADPVITLHLVVKNVQFDMQRDFSAISQVTTQPIAVAVHASLPVKSVQELVAYAKAIEALSGVDVGKLLPIPDISNKRFPEAKKHEAKGLHQILYRMSPNDYKDISKIWSGTHPEDGSALRVVDGPPEGAPVPKPLRTDPAGGGPAGCCCTRARPSTSPPCASR